jgi:hypothetical protein
MSHAKSFWTRIIILPGFSCFRSIFYPESSGLDLNNEISQNSGARGIAGHEIFFLTNLARKIDSKELSEPSFYIARGGDELILEIHLCESSVAGAPQTVAPH